MSQIDQLIAKALSTDSEDEAIACLRMARRQGKSTTKKDQGIYAGQSAKYWYERVASLAKDNYRTRSAYNQALEDKKQLKESAKLLRRQIVGLIIAVPMVAMFVGVIVTMLIPETSCWLF